MNEQWLKTEDVVPCAEAGATRRDKYEVKICGVMEVSADYCPGNQQWFTDGGANITHLITHWRPMAGVPYVSGGQDHRPQFERDLDNFVRVKRPGCMALECDCVECGFFGYVVFEVQDFIEFCPRCGCDGFGSQHKKSMWKKFQDSPWFPLVMFAVIFFGALCGAFWLLDTLLLDCTALSGPVLPE